VKKLVREGLVGKCGVKCARGRGGRKGAWTVAKVVMGDVETGSWRTGGGQLGEVGHGTRGAV